MLPSRVPRRIQPFISARTAQVESERIQIWTVYCLVKIRAVDSRNERPDRLLGTAGKHPRLAASPSPGKTPIDRSENFYAIKETIVLLLIPSNSLPVNYVKRIQNILSSLNVTWPRQLIKFEIADNTKIRSIVLISSAYYTINDYTTHSREDTLQNSLHHS